MIPQSRVKYGIKRRILACKPEYVPREAASRSAELLTWSKSRTSRWERGLSSFGPATWSSHAWVDIQSCLSESTFSPSILSSFGGLFAQIIYVRPALWLPTLYYFTVLYECWNFNYHCMCVIRAYCSYL